MDIPRLLVHEYTDILGEFKLHSQSTYITCAVLVIAINLVVACFFLRKRFLGENVSSVMLISLVISDIAYEMTTTVFLAQCRCYPEKTLSKDCSNQTLYAMYMTFNLSTVLHVVFEMLKKIFAEDFIRIQWPVFAKYASVSLSFVLWCTSFLLAYGYTYWWNDTMRFVNINVNVYLCRFKVFGYYIYVIIVFSFFVVILLTLLVKKSRKEPEKRNLDSFMNESYPAKAKIDQELFHTTPKEQPQLVFLCLFLAIAVGSFGWFLTLGNLMRFIEIMKWFEIIRLGARVLNLLTVFFAITKSDFCLY